MDHLIVFTVVTHCGTFSLMKSHKITTGGQVSLPATVRHRWGAKSVSFEDLGDHLTVRPFPDDPIAAARGALGKRSLTTEELRAKARQDEANAESRR